MNPLPPVLLLISLLVDIGTRALPLRTWVCIRGFRASERSQHGVLCLNMGSALTSGVGIEIGIEDDETGRIIKKDEERPPVANGETGATSCWCASSSRRQ